MRIMVAEDHAPSLEAISAFLESEGHEVLGATDGAAALKIMEYSRPDLCLLDVNLPKVDGFHVAESIRQRYGPRWIPIIFLSARTQLDDMITGLESGGDDYLTKLVNFKLLGAKIRAMGRINELQSELARHYDRIEEEHQLAQSLLERLSNSSGRQDPALKWAVIPLHRFSGDQISAFRTETGVLTVLLADAMGHGLPAAICLMPILKTFASMAPSGEPLKALAEAMNREYRALIPSTRFVALLMIRMDPRRRDIQVWNGGIPTCVVLEDGGSVLKQFDSQHPPIGVLPEELFDGEPETFAWDEGAQASLVAASDGMTEAFNERGEPFDQLQMLQTWQEGPGETGFERLLAGVFAHLAGEPLVDDLSLLSIRCR